MAWRTCVGFAKVVRRKGDGDEKEITVNSMHKSLIQLASQTR